MTNDLIARAEAALEGTTPGPWDVNHHRMFGLASGEDRKSRWVALALWQCDHEESQDDANARFIAASRQLVPELVEALRAAEARDDSLHSILDEVLAAAQEVTDDLAMVLQALITERRERDALKDRADAAEDAALQHDKLRAAAIGTLKHVSANLETATEALMDIAGVGAGYSADLAVKAIREIGGEG